MTAQDRELLRALAFATVVVAIEIPISALDAGWVSWLSALVLGAAASFFISHIYYRRSTKETP